MKANYLVRWVGAINKLVGKSWTSLAQNKEEWRKGEEVYAVD